MKNSFKVLYCALLFSASINMQAMMSPAASVITGSTIAAATTGVGICEYLDRKDWLLVRNADQNRVIAQRNLKLTQGICTGAMFAGATFSYITALILIKDSSSITQDASLLVTGIGAVTVTAVAHLCKHRMLLSEMRKLIPVADEATLHRPLLQTQA